MKSVPDMFCAIKNCFLSSGKIKGEKSSKDNLYIFLDYFEQLF